MQYPSLIFIICAENIAFFCYFRKIALPLQKFAKSILNLCNMETSTFWQKLRNCLISKYAIALYVFILMILFMGDNSLIQYIKRAKKIRAVQELIHDTNQNTAQSQSILNTLDNVDSLERFAREQYRMHAPNEDVYIVEP